MNGDAYPAAVSQKVAKNLPVSFYSPMPGFNLDVLYLKEVTVITAGILSDMMVTPCCLVLCVKLLQLLSGLGLTCKKILYLK